jgi:multiple sugar transport system permease protein
MEALTAYLFILPTLLGFLVFNLGALIAGLGLSFFHYDFFTPLQFTGLHNFRMLLQDIRVAKTFGNTVYFAIGMFLFDLIWAMALALALNSYMPNILKLTFRLVFFFPVLTAGAVIALVWRYLFNMDLGIINWFLGEFGVPKLPWLISSAWVRPSIVLATVWNGVGFNMILLLAGLHAIPQTLYEAARIDGAGRVASFRYISSPLLTPTLFFIMVKGFIGVLQLFDQPYMLTGGGPGDASRTIVMYIYETGFRHLRLGFASAIALGLFLVIVIITVVQFAVSRRWVFYR